MGEWRSEWKLPHYLGFRADTKAPTTVNTPPKCSTVVYEGISGKES